MRESCPNCNTVTEDELFYTRLRIKRFAFIYTLSFIISASLLIAGVKGPGLPYMVFMFLTGFPILLMLIYYSVNEYFTGSASKKTKNEISIFREIYLSNNKPAKEEIIFSWPKYIKEALHFLGIFLIFAFLGAGLILANKLLSK